MKNLGFFFGVTFICMGNAIKSKKNTLKTIFDQIFKFHFSKGGSERYPKGMDWSTTVFEVFFLDLMAFPMHINVRPKNSAIFHF